MMNHYKSYDYDIEKIKDHLSLSMKRSDFYYFVFLCGKELNKSETSLMLSNRELVKQYFYEKTSNIKVVLAENLYDRIKNKDIDLLTYEELLFDLSDRLILFVESYGTFAELGAFSMSDLQGIKKLTVINDIEHKDDQSFINDGPIKKIKEKGAKVIYADLTHGTLLGNRDVMNELNAIIGESRISRNKKVNDGSKIRVNSFIFEIIELLRLYGPINQKDLLDIYKLIKGFDSFDFVKNDGKTFTDSNQITPYTVFDIMKSIGFVNEIDDELYLNKDTKNNAFLFNFTEYGRNRFRSRILRKRFKKGDDPCIRV